MGLISLDLATGEAGDVTSDPGDFDGPIAALRLTEPVRSGRYAGAVLDRAMFGAALARLRTQLSTG